MATYVVVCDEEYRVASVGDCCVQGEECSRMEDRIEAATSLEALHLFLKRYTVESEDITIRVLKVQ
jgi:hypothetical protein